MKSTLGAYAACSFVFALGVVVYAFHTKRYFYASTVFLARSKVSTLALTNAIVASVLVLGKVIQSVFLGPLRFREQERLQIRVRDAVIETCLAMTVFRDEFDAKFFGMFAVLLFVKVFHWLSRDRVENMEEQLLVPVRTHMKLVFLMLMLLLTDVYVLVQCISITVTKGPSMLVLFTFEFAVLLLWLVSTMVRYAFQVIDARYDGHWEAKGLCSFYNELISDFLQLVVYIAFFMYVQAFYTLPLHIIRDIYLTFNKFQKRVSDFIRYRKVASTMNELFSEPTEEDFEQMDRICIICRDEMSTSGCKKLGCNHIFHTHCLQGWLRRQLNCPVCRTAIEVPASDGTSRANANAGPARLRIGNQDVLLGRGDRMFLRGLQATLNWFASKLIALRNYRFWGNRYPVYQQHPQPLNVRLVQVQGNSNQPGAPQYRVVPVDMQQMPAVQVWPATAPQGYFAVPSARGDHLRLRRPGQPFQTQASSSRSGVAQGEEQRGNEALRVPGGNMAAASEASQFSQGAALNEICIRVQAEIGALQHALAGKTGDLGCAVDVFEKTEILQKQVCEELGNAVGLERASQLLDRASGLAAEEVQIRLSIQKAVQLFALIGTVQEEALSQIESVS
ncbi:ERAD-associated E3 ubiquitin-protein ligase HRD1B [Porphyridium purpureum]|uniref:RING-type E3 ubiquitin transferase n=1 Tax=Porphyridium purpureum TaxID=35688 RepID=A0A5J4YLY9_PORPP|nr:ERAD-associated E3 ubiquitin-protein ligase HRD1B [Porphyridium purpureum]|eukprot:POR2662..scf295_9